MKQVIVQLRQFLLNRELAIVNNAQEFIDNSQLITYENKLQCQSKT